MAGSLNGPQGDRYSFENQKFDSQSSLNTRNKVFSRNPE
jgi:hypothetical protein